MPLCVLLGIIFPPIRKYTKRIVKTKPERTARISPQKKKLLQLFALLCVTLNSPTNGLARSRTQMVCRNRVKNKYSVVLPLCVMCMELRYNLFEIYLACAFKTACCRCMNVNRAHRPEQLGLG